MWTDPSRDSSVLMTASRPDVGQPGTDVRRVRRTRTSQKTAAREPSLKRALRRDDDDDDDDDGEHGAL